MQLMVPRDPSVASLQRRAAAWAIDAVCICGALATGAAAAFGVAWLRKRPDDLDELIEQPPQGGPSTGSSARALSGASMALTLVDRNLRSPGKRAMGLRRVDAATLGPVRMRSAVIQSVMTSAESHVVFHLCIAPRLRRFKEWSRSIDEHRAEMRRRNTDDARTDEQLLCEMVKHKTVPEAPSCLPAALPLLVQLVVALITVLRSRRRQTLRQRVAGTVVIDTR